jgi:hypothetical protein
VKFVAIIPQTSHNFGPKNKDSMKRTKGILYMKIKKQLMLCCIHSLFPISAFSQVLFYNAGEVYVHENASEGVTLYVPGSQVLTKDSRVTMNGVERLNGDLIVRELSPASNGFNTAAGQSGKLLFKGETRQRITNNGAAYNRTLNYLGKIPVLEIENRADVLLSDSMGLSVDTLTLTRGKLILASSYVNPNETRVAHLLVKDSVKYNRPDTAVVEIELIVGNNPTERDGKFIAFSPPFKRMYADYFVYNYLLAPDPSGLAGANKAAITDPGYPLEAGHGYIIGQKVYGRSDPNDYLNVMPAWNLEQVSETFPMRMKDTLLLNRYALKGIRIVEDAGGPITQSDAYTGESLNTQDVMVHLKKGYNYLGNPYTCPIDLSTLEYNEDDPDEWGVSRINNTTGDKDIYAGYWIMHSGFVKNPNFANKKFTISVSYDVSQLVGSTVTTDTIPPMQLFVINALRECTIKIPASKRTHGNTNYLKRNKVVTDELLLEVRDQTTKGFDRACIVFRNHASTDATDTYDASKILNTSGGVSQINITSTDGKNLITSVIPTEEATLPLTLLPSATEQEVEIAASRLETLFSPEAVQLEDLKTGAVVDLTQNSYRFTTHPEDNSNRFILHFRNILGTGMEMQSLTPLRVVYASGELTVSGLRPADAGARIAVADVQGRILLQEVIPPEAGETGKISYRATMSAGVYVAALSGNRSLTSKFAVK